MYNGMLDYDVMAQDALARGLMLHKAKTPMASLALPTNPSGIRDRNLMRHASSFEKDRGS